MTPNVLVADDTDGVISDDDEEQEPATTEPESKPKSMQDDQLHKAVEVLKSRTS